MVYSLSKTTPFLKSLRLMLLIVIACVAFDSLEPVQAQSLKEQQTRGLKMLDTIKQDVKEYYFDPTFHGLDLDAHFKKAGEQIKQAVDGNQILGIIGYTLLAFEDRHTLFIPPVLGVRVDYGWEMKMVGNKCYVVSVKNDSDAGAKGLHAGDRILSVFDIEPTRDNLWQIKYLFYSLRPLNAMNVVVQSPGGKPRQLELLTKVRKTTLDSLEDMARAGGFSYQYYYNDVVNDIFIWKMPNFLINEKGVDVMMKMVGQHKALILDLRGNGGGYLTSLQRLLGYFFDYDVVIGEERSRKNSTKVIAKSAGSRVFTGRVVVLVDSDSASAAEVFARTLQRTSRGIVVGDITSGTLRGAKHFKHVFEIGYIVTLTYEASVTFSELIMPDGKSLERIGVTPDKLLLPDDTALANGEDPVLIDAAEIVGVRFDPRKAGPPAKFKTENR